MTEKCQFYLANGLAPSTGQVYGLAQRSFLEFCSQDIPSDPGHPLLLASEQTLMRFCAHSEDRFHHSSIKVYLLAVCSLHIDYGYPDPLSNCLQLQHLLRGIKQHQGSNPHQRQPVTADLMGVLHQSLDLSNPDNVMLWATCYLGFFGVASLNIFSGRYSLKSNQNTGMLKQQRGYLFYTNTVIPHKTSQQAHARLATTLDLHHSGINTRPLLDIHVHCNLSVTLQQTNTTSVDTYKASKLYTRASSYFSKLTHKIILSALLGNKTI